MDLDPGLGSTKKISLNLGSARPDDPDPTHVHLYCQL